MFGVIEKDCAVLVPLDSWSKELEREKAVLSAIKKSQIGLVMPNYGLVVSCYEVRETKEEMFLIDGVVRVCVCVALVVFNPQKGVVLTGVVTAVNGDAVQLSTGFFGQIFVPRSEWGRLKLSKGASDGAPILVDSEKPSFCVVVGDRIRARVLGCESSNQGMRVTCSLVGEFFGPLAWFVQQEG